MNDEMNMEMFLIKCSVKSKKNGALDVEFNIGVNSDINDFFKLIGKQKEYEKYVQKIAKSFSQAFTDANDVTFNFFEDELNDENIVGYEFYENVLKKLLKGSN